MITEDIQKANVGSVITLFKIDATNLGVANPYYWHSGNGLNAGSIFWQSQEYTQMPIEASGFERTGSGIQPRPTLRIANVTHIISALALSYDDLIGTVVVRKRTLLKYLDASNFVGGNKSADPNQYFPDELYHIFRKSKENKVFVEFELSAPWDVEGIMLPRRQVIQNTCTFKYRGAECGYTGGPVATILDAYTADPNLDVCGKRLHSCKLRFGLYAELPYGGFPGVGKIR